jgi:hypothetical protein
MSLIGRLVLERSEAKKKRALIKSEIDRFSLKFSNVTASSGTQGMPPKPEDSAEMRRALQHVDELLQVGGLDKLKELMSEYVSLGDRISEIGQTLRNAGAE